MYLYGCIEMTSHGGPYGNLVNYMPSHRKTRLSKRSERKHMNRPTCLGTSSSRKHLHERRLSTPTHSARSPLSERCLRTLTHSPFASISAAALRINSAHCCDLCSWLSFVAFRLLPFQSTTMSVDLEPGDLGFRRKSPLLSSNLLRQHIY